MKYLFFLICLSASTTFSQSFEQALTELEVLRIEQKLSSNEFQGRKPGTAGIEKAASFIEEEFKLAGLGYLPGLNSFRQNFSMFKVKTLNVNGNADGKPIDQNKIIIASQEEKIFFDEVSDFEKVLIPADSNLLLKAQKYLDEKKSYIVFVDTAHARGFRMIRRLDRNLSTKVPTVIFVLMDTVPLKYVFDIKQEVRELKLSNIVGVLPGKSRSNEHVIFSAHYDHLGIGKKNAEGDSIYNGANDDASGVTALILLGKYFSKIDSNERSLVFSAFTAEEDGGIGSKYFSEQMDPAKVAAMFNIEMIGTESKWGTNSAYITGYDKSDLGKILEKNLAGSKFNFYPDPYPDQKLFYRSDNASLAVKGVPAHSISTSKMDAEPYYHSQDDEIETLDLQNMTEIIKAIALSAKGIIEGKDTPTRIER